MKYKNTRKKVIKQIYKQPLFTLDKSELMSLISNIEKDLLAKEDNKDQRYVYCCPVHGEYYKVCPKCNPTPSPLEIEEIERILFIGKSIFRYDSETSSEIEIARKLNKVIETVNLIIKQLK